jgi:hypothetical protein
MWVADTLANDPDFIKAGLHIGSFITVAVDTEKEQAITKALKCYLEFASEQNSISSLFLFYNTTSIFANPNTSLLAATHRVLSIEWPIHKSCSQEFDWDSTSGRWVGGERVQTDPFGS